jgi:hypothetical protein
MNFLYNPLNVRKCTYSAIEIKVPSLASIRAQVEQNTISIHYLRAGVTLRRYL